MQKSTSESARGVVRGEIVHGKQRRINETQKAKPNKVISKLKVVVAMVTKGGEGKWRPRAKVTKSVRHSWRVYFLWSMTFTLARAPSTSKPQLVLSSILPSGLRINVFCQCANVPFMMYREPFFLSNVPARTVLDG